MDFEVIETIVHSALNKLKQQDHQLLEISINERTISHKLAEYMQKEFSDLFVDCEYNRHHELPIHFVGGIAFGFKDLLTEACARRSLKIGTVLKKPIEGLIKYHLNGN